MDNKIDQAGYVIGETLPTIRQITAEQKELALIQDKLKNFHTKSLRRILADAWTKPENLRKKIKIFEVEDDGSRTEIVTVTEKMLWDELYRRDVDSVFWTFE
jgi:hypothetical protein